MQGSDSEMEKVAETEAVKGGDSEMEKDEVEPDEENSKNDEEPEEEAEEEAEEEVEEDKNSTNSNPRIDYDKLKLGNINLFSSSLILN